jgi:hypothetical protein
MNLLRSSLLVLALVLPLATGCGPETPAGSEPTDAQLAQTVDSLNAAAESQGKVEVCHVPPGNPAREHTIVVGTPAVAAHLAHGDRVGSCEAPAEGGDEGSPDAGVPDSGSADLPPPPLEMCWAAGSRCDADRPCCTGLTCGAEGYCATPEVIIE